MDPRAREAAQGMLVAAASIALTTVAIYALREQVPVVSLGVLYLLAVLLVSSRWGLVLGLATSLASAAAFNYFHIPPTGRFAIADGDNWVALAVLLVAAAVTSTLAGRARVRAREAEQRSREADLAAEMARLLLGGESVEEGLRAAGQRIARAFELPACSVELAWRDGDERRRALPLIVDGDRVGTVLVPRDTPPPTLAALERRVLPSLETLAGAARRREGLEAQVIETKALRRSNVVKTALLRSMSHDLRSPLTAITAAAGGLASTTLDEAERRELTAVISEESARLTRLVDDLLDLSRLQAGGLEPRTELCAIDEIVRAAVTAVRAPPGGFDLALDDDLPLLPADAAQLERALANVLENCVRYAGTEPVSVRARAAGRFLTLRVSDRGPGIARAELERIFEPFHRSRERPGGGSGLGLAIARGFVEANGGRLRAESLPGQGASFVLQFPLAAEAAARPAAAPAAGAARGTPAVTSGDERGA